MPYQDLAYDAVQDEDVQQKGASAPAENFTNEGQYWRDENNIITYLTYDEFIADTDSVAIPLTPDTVPPIIRVVNGEPYFKMKNRFFVAFGSTNGNTIRTLYEFNADRYFNEGGQLPIQPLNSVKCGEYKSIPIFEADPTSSNERPDKVVAMTTSENGTETTTTTSEAGGTESSTGAATETPDAPNTTTEDTGTSVSPETVSTDPPPGAATGNSYTYGIMRAGYDRYDFNTGKKVVDSKTYSSTDPIISLPTPVPDIPPVGPQ